MRPAPGSPGAARMRAHHPTAAGRTSGRRPPGTGWCAPPLRSKVAQARHRETPRMPGHRPPRSTAGTICNPSPCQCSCSFPRSPPVPQPGILRHPAPHCIHQHRIVGVLTPPAENAPVPREVWISTAPARRPEPLLFLFHSCCGRSRGMANPGCEVHPRGRGGTHVYSGTTPLNLPHSSGIRMDEQQSMRDERCGPETLAPPLPSPLPPWVGPAVGAWGWVAGVRSCPWGVFRRDEESAGFRRVR